MRINTVSRWSGALVLAALLVATPASAARYVLTVTGNLQTDPAFNSDQTDRHGLFGTTGRVMSGEAFTARWAIDTASPWQVIPPDIGSVTTVIRGGNNPFYAYGDGIIGSFTMAGRTIRDIGLSTNPFNGSTGIGSQSQIAVSDYDNSPQDLFAINATSGVNNPGGVLIVNGRSLAGGTIAMNLGFGARNVYTPGVFFDTFDLSAAAGDLSGGANGQFAVGGNGMGSNYYFRIATIAMAAAPAGVPEPASWALLIAGFGLVGAAMRRRAFATA